MVTTVNDFIKRLKCIDRKKRDLPIVIACPNGSLVFPEIKFQYSGNGNPLVKGNVVEKLVITCS